MSWLEHHFKEAVSTYMVAHFGSVVFRFAYWLVRLRAALKAGGK